MYLSSEHDFYIPQVRKVQEGNNLTISCNVTHSLDMAVFWKKNDSQVSFYENGTDLQLNKINRSESGDYICFSYNLTYETEANASVLAIFFVDVLCEF